MPLNIGDALNSAFSNIRDHIGLLVKLGLLLYVLPSFILNTLVVIITPMFLIGMESTLVETNPGALLGAIGTGFFIAIALAIIVGLLQLLFSITMIKVYSEKRQGVELSVGQAISKGKEYFLSAIGLSIIMGFALFFLFLALIIPGIIFLVFWVFAMYALVIDNKSSTEAMGFSKKLVKGHWWAMFLTIIVMFIAGAMVGVFAGVLTIPFMLIPIVGDIVSNAISLVVSLFVTIITVAIMEAIYMNLRGQNDPSVAEQTMGQQPVGQQPMNQQTTNQQSIQPPNQF